MDKLFLKAGAFMFENQEEFIFELYDKNGKYLDRCRILHTSEDGRYLPVYPLPEKDNLNILGKPN